MKEEQITNRTGSDATTPQEASAKLQMIMEKLKAGTQFADVAADFSEDPQTAPRGGDLGFLPRRPSRSTPPQLRDAVLTAKPGSAKVIGADGGYVIVVVLGKDTAGQKDLGTPGVKDAISQSLKGSPRAGAAVGLHQQPAQRRGDREPDRQARRRVAGEGADARAGGAGRTVAGRVSGPSPGAARFWPTEF